MIGNSWKWDSYSVDTNKLDWKFDFISVKNQPKLIFECINENVYVLNQHTVIACWSIVEPKSQLWISSKFLVKITSEFDDDEMNKQMEIQKKNHDWK